MTLVTPGIEGRLAQWQENPEVETVVDRSLYGEVKENLGLKPAMPPTNFNSA